MRSCLSSELMDRYIAGQCTAEECVCVQAHLSDCDNCRRKVESIGPGDIIPRPNLTTNVTQTVTRDICQGNVADPSEVPTRSMPVETDSSLDTVATKGEAVFAFDNYRITEELPRGGQAIVYKAIHIPTNTKVAIKVLLPSLLASKRARYYFEREVEIIASLDHPNIIKIRDSGIIHGQYFFVMEYVDGQPLDRYVSSKNLSFRERIILFNKISATVTYAHQQGFIHRDLKFANILVDKRAEPHILDFGLAKVVGLSELATKNAMPTMTGQWAGSLTNMSPEQASGKPSLIDMRTDVYALGVILYHLLTDRYPYDVTGSIIEALQNIQKSEPVRPSTIIRKFDSDIEAILLTALEKDREQRYQSAIDLKSDIDNWLEGRPIRVKSVSSIYLLRKIIARHRYTSSVAGLLLLIIIGFTYFSFDLYITAKKAKQKSDTIAKRWSKEAGRNLTLSRQLTFTRCSRSFPKILHYTDLSGGMA